MTFRCPHGQSALARFDGPVELSGVHRGTERCVGTVVEHDVPGVFHNGAALRRAYAQAETGSPAAPGHSTGIRGHVRRAHWHTILSGPRIADGAAIAPEQRKRDLRWMPPIAVALDDLDTLPATVRRVRD